MVPNRISKIESDLLLKIYRSNDLDEEETLSRKVYHCVGHVGVESVAVNSCQNLSLLWWAAKSNTTKTYHPTTYRLNLIAIESTDLL